MGTNFLLIALLLGICIGAPSSRAQIRCAPSDAAASGAAAQKSTADFALPRYRSDVVACVDEKQGRRASDRKANAGPAKDVAPLLDWIVAKTGWTNREPPPVHVIPYAELVKMFTGDKPTDFHVEAIYSEQDHSVYLPDGWRADDLRSRSILLHELVHHLQYLNHVEGACGTEYELQAVKLQIMWLGEQGVKDPLDLLGINPLYLLMLGRCE